MGRGERAVVGGRKARVSVGLVHAEHEGPGHAVRVHDPDELVRTALHPVDVVTEMGVRVEDVGAFGELLAQLGVPERAELERAFDRSVHRASL